MKYRELKKLYYSEPPEIYNKIYEERKNGLSSIRLDFQIGKEEAFLVLDPEVFDVVTKIYQKDKQLTRFLSSHKLPPVAIEQYKERCLIDEIVMTNGIEGVNSTRKEISEILEVPPKRKRSRRFEGLVKKYQILYNEENILIESCADIRKLYNESFLKEVMEDDPDSKPDGELFRSGSVAIQNPSQKEIHTGVYPEKKIIELMTKALEYLNNGKENLLVRIAVFHYCFGYIHPFYDGNGRMSRFISSYFLGKELESLVGFRLSYIIKQNVGVYYRLFDKVNDPKNMGDITPFVIGFLEIILSAVESLHNELLEKRNELEYYRKLMEKCGEFMDEVSIGCAYVLLQASLFSEKGVLIRELSGTVRKSEPTTRKYLKSMEEEQWLIVNKEGHKKYYQLNLKKLEK